MADPDGLKHAFEGAERVLVVSSASSSGALAAGSAVIDVAREAGAQRIVHTSHQAAFPRRYGLLPLVRTCSCDSPGILGGTRRSSLPRCVRGPPSRGVAYDVVLREAWIAQPMVHR